MDRQVDSHLRECGHSYRHCYGNKSYEDKFGMYFHGTSYSEWTGAGTVFLKRYHGSG